jgi:hypothetical protein
MEQKNIREFGGNQYTKEEGAALIKELNDRTVSDDEGYNSIADLAERVKYFSKGVLTGSQYVFVAGNGTDVENAIELQTAYNLAKTKSNSIQVLSNSYDFPYQFVPGEIVFDDFNGTLPVLILGESYTFNVEGVDMVGEVLESSFFFYIIQFTPFDYFGGDIAVYSVEILRSKVIVAPGNYNFESSNFIMDTDYVDLVSLDGNRSIIFNGTKTIEITANNVFVKGINVKDKEFIIGNDLSKLKVENCQGGNGSFCGNSVIASGTFKNCQGGDYSFAGYEGLASGNFINCVGGNNSFGGGSGTASGSFVNCQGGDFSFCGGSGTASGSFVNCQGGVFSFGGFEGLASGNFINCVAELGSFAGFGGTASGTFRYCIGGNNSFGRGGTASGIFINCQGGVFSFGGLEGLASGNFINCVAELGSFAGFGGTASGTFISCISDKSSFGGINTNPGGSQGVLSGKLYYCILKSGTFQTVSSGGRTVLCIDGNKNQNNQ